MLNLAEIFSNFEGEADYVEDPKEILEQLDSKLESIQNKITGVISEKDPEKRKKSRRNLKISYRPNDIPSVAFKDKPAPLGRIYLEDRNKGITEAFGMDGSHHFSVDPNQRAA